MHTHPEIAITRVERFLREVLGPRVHRDRVELSVAAWTAPGEPVTPEAALSANFEPFDVGSPWGRPWGTTWMHLTGSIPVSWPEDDTSRRSSTWDSKPTDPVSRPREPSTTTAAESSRVSLHATATSR